MKYFIFYDTIKFVSSRLHYVAYNFVTRTIKPIESEVATILLNLYQHSIEETQKKYALEPELLDSLIDSITKEGFGFVSDETIFKLRKPQPQSYSNDSKIEVLDLYLTGPNLDFLVKHQLILGRLGLNCVIVRSFQPLTEEIKLNLSNLTLPYVVYNINYPIAQKEVEELKALSFLKITSNFDGKNIHEGIIPIVEQSKFFMTQDVYFESLDKNIYYNNRVFILKDGTISDSELSHELGLSVRDSIDKIINAIRRPDFSRFGNIAKKEIAECRECTFRYMCMDKRIPMKNEKGYHFADKCKTRKVV